MSLTLNPPRSATAPVTDTLHGVKITDPYRWLEDQNSPRTRKWLEEQAAYTRGYLDVLPGRDRIRQRIEQLLAVEVISEPWKVGNRYFYLKRKSDQEQPVIMMREGESKEEIVLVDPTRRDATGATAVSIINISSEGALLAYSVRERGEDSCVVEFFDVALKRILQDHLPRGFCRGVVFAKDRTGFYYSHETIDATRPSRHAVCWHSFGTSNQEDQQVFFAGESEKLRLILFGSPNGQRLGFYKLVSGDPTTIDFFVYDVGTQRLRPVVEQIEGLFVPFLLDDRLLGFTDWKAPNCRVVQIDWEGQKDRNWRDLVPELNYRIHDVAIADRLILVSYVRDLGARIEVFDFDGHHRDTLRLPSKGTAHLFPCKPDSQSVFYRFSSFSDAPSVHCYRTPAREQETWARSQVPLNAASIVVDESSYASRDGTRVPIFLVRQKTLQRNRPLPTFLTGYGGFANSITPQFTAYATCLMESGCLFAVANVRGGAEFGEEWHLAAKREKRQTAIDDFIAAAEWLSVAGHTIPGRLAIGGGSNAGLLVGAALTQRPDLFRAVVCLGPLLDMLRYHLFDVAYAWVDEFGSADNEKDFRHLLNFSPYQRIENGVAYPAVMLISGDADTRCNPMHARKMTAKLQSATASRHPILLDYKTSWGHMPVQGRTRRVEALTDRLAFICHELGVGI